MSELVVIFPQMIGMRFLYLTFILLSSLTAFAQKTEGMASFYADRFHGRPTSTGEAYDKQALTAASKDYPYGTILEVTEVVSGKSVQVRVNDCGPHNPRRLIDLSRAAAKQIGLLRKGVARVKLRVVSLGDQGSTCGYDGPPVLPAEGETTDSIPADTAIAVQEVAPARADTTSLTQASSLTKETRAKGVAPKRVFAPDEMLFGVQVGAYGKEDNAQAMVEQLTNLGFDEVFMARVGKVYRVFAGKFYFQDEAEALREQVREAGFRGASVRRVQ